MAAFRQLCSIAVHHTYYSDGLCRKLAFVPTSATAALIKRAGLLLHSTEIGVQIFLESEKTDVLRHKITDPGEISLLVFQVFLQDASFWYYTTPQIPGNGSLLYFDSRKGFALEDGSLRLHQGTYAAKDDLERIDAPAVADPLHARERMKNPGMLIVLDLAPVVKAIASTDSAPGLGEHHIHFKARETLWRYYLLSVDQQRKLTIVDKNNTCEFRAVGQESLPDGRMALAFISTRCIPITQRSKNVFQLKEQGAGGEKVLIRRLPAAFPNQQRNEVINGQTVTVSDIFINC